MSQRTLWTAALWLAVILVVVGQWYQHREDQPEQTLNRIDGVTVFPTPLSVSDFNFINQYGDAVTQADLLGRWQLVFFGFTFCPDICPTTLADLSRSYRQLSAADQAQWHVVLVSIDPERDTPEMLQPYMQYFNSEFIALTGNPEALPTLASELNAFYARAERPDGMAYLMDHSANLALIDPQGRYRGFIEPPHDAARMVPILETVLKL
ncbi:MAG: SCO family protein [Bacterioplanes sp.]|nr:SCO family protein [Bacterioplanes sp.]